MNQQPPHSRYEPRRQVTPQQPQAAAGQQKPPQQASQQPPRQAPVPQAPQPQQPPGPDPDPRLPGGPGPHGGFGGAGNAGGQEVSGGRPSSSGGGAGKKRWGLAAGALALAAVSAAAGFGGGVWFAGRGGDEAPQASAPQQTTGEKREYLGDGPDFVGRRPSDTSGLAGQELARTSFYVTSSRLQYEAFDGTLPPQLCTIISIQNDTDDLQHITSDDFIAYTPDGEEVQTGLGVVGDYEMLLSHDSPPGDEVDLSLCFLSDKDPQPGQWLVAYVGNIYGGERLVWINNL